MSYKGIYREMTDEIYHGERAHLSSSNYKTLLKNAAKFKKEKIDGDYEQKSSDAFLLGHYVHSLILEPHTVPEKYIVYSGFRRAGADWENFKQNHTDRQILSKGQGKKGEQMIDAFSKNQAAVKLVEGGEAELSLFGKYHDIPTKVRADYINVEQGYIADVKTTSYPTDKESFGMTIKQFGYQLSAALYLNMFEQYYEKPLDFYFIVLGKQTGLCDVFKLSKASRELGERSLLEAVSKYKKCVETGIWKDESKEFGKRDLSTDFYEILEV